jgi:hypothetical protein
MRWTRSELRAGWVIDLREFATARLAAAVDLEAFFF